MYFHYLMLASTVPLVAISIDLVSSFLFSVFYILSRLFVILFLFCLVYLFFCSILFRNLISCLLSSVISAVSSFLFSSLHFVPLLRFPLFIPSYSRLSFFFPSNFTSFLGAVFFTPLYHCIIITNNLNPDLVKPRIDFYTLKENERQAKTVTNTHL